MMTASCLPRAAPALVATMTTAAAGASITARTVDKTSVCCLKGADPPRVVSLRRGAFSLPPPAMSHVLCLVALALALVALGDALALLSEAISDLRDIWGNRE